MDLLEREFILEITKNEEYQINAEIFGEGIDLRKHEFKVEIKSPTFHEMEIEESNKVRMKYLLDL